MIQARVSDDFLHDGVAIGVRMAGSEDGPTQRYARLNADGDGRTWITWESPGGPTMAREPTFRLQHEVARALLDALLRFYEGASDMHQVRQDLLHERGRVDRLLETLQQLAARPRNLHIHKAEQ